MPFPILYYETLFHSYRCAQQPIIKNGSTQPIGSRTEPSDWVNPNQRNCRMYQFPSCKPHMKATVRKPVIWDNHFDISDITAINVFLIRDFTVLFIYSCQMCAFYPMLLHFGCLLTPWYKLCCIIHPCIHHFRVYWNFALAAPVFYAIHIVLNLMCKWS